MDRNHRNREAVYMSDWYVLNSLEDFVITSRKLVFNSFGKTEEEEESLLDISPKDQKEFDEVITQEESMVIVRNLLRKQINKKTQEERYLITDDIMTEIINSLNDRMVSNILNGLVNKGLIESAYDTESNDFIFWIKDNEEQNNQTSESN